jgi:hypothetical protein
LLALCQKKILPEEVMTMKKAGALLSAALLMGGLSTAALAFAEGHAGVLMTRGTISRIERDSGKVELMTEKGPAQVYFAPDLLTNLEEGDEVALELQTAPSHLEAYKRDMEQQFPHTAKPDEE